MADNMTGGARGERATGTPNTIYDLSSVLFHALEGGASYDTYIEDAERDGNGELADFFRRVRDKDSMRADEAQRLLAERTPTPAVGTGVEPVGDATAPSEGLATGAPRREETTDGLEGRPDVDVAPTGPSVGAGRGEPGVPAGAGEAPPPRMSRTEEGVLPRTEGTPPSEGALTGGASRRTGDDGPLGREDAREPEGEREEDKGLLDRAKDALLGEEEEHRRREGTDRPDRR